MLYLIKKVIHNNGFKFENIKSTQKKIKITEIIDPVLKNCFGLDS